VQGVTLGGQVDLGVAADQPVGFEPGEKLADRAGVQVRRAFKVADHRFAG
jgi:hypothetical protein